MRNRFRAGFGLIELLIAAAVVIFLYYLGAKFYFKRPLMNKEVEQTLEQQGINTANYKTILDSTKAKLSGIRKQQEEQILLK